MARKTEASTVQEFAVELAEYLSANNPQGSKTSVEIEEKSWNHLIVGGESHPTAFTRKGPELQTAEVVVEKGAPRKVFSGHDGLMILKTTKSAFTGYLKDNLTTLEESTDRIFGTRATVQWEYAEAPEETETARRTALSTLLQAFADHDSLSVQHTLYDLGAAVLAAVPEVARITLTMPNLHCLFVDLSRFGQDNPNQIYVPTDEPYGNIEATIER